MDFQFIIIQGLLTYIAVLLWRIERHLQKMREK